MIKHIARGFATLLLLTCFLGGGLLTDPPVACAAGITYLPGASTTDVVGSQPNLSVLTWQLPGGVLVVDRLAAAPASTNRFGETFQPAYTVAEWFLVRAEGSLGQTSGPLSDLHTLGTIHLEDGAFYLVEIPAENLEKFTHLPLRKNRLPLTLPPQGWDTYPVSSSLGDALAKRDESLVQAFVDQVDPSAYYLLLQEISGAASFWYEGAEQTITTRYYNTTDNDLVAAYLASILADYGYAVQFDEFSYNGYTCRNVVATKVGTTFQDEFVVLGGHYDSTSPVHSLAPGAEDNGSGTSLVMEVARIAAERQFERSLQFVLFDSEEQGLNGSYNFVDVAVSTGRNIVAAIIADMVSWYSSHYAVIIEGDEPWEWLMTTMENNVASFTPLGSRKDYYSWGSDHVPFQQAGISAFLAIDWDWNNYPHYHQTTDTWAQIADTAEIGTQIAKACAATLADVAGLLPPASGISDGLPQVSRYLQAFPNPFNPQVTIAFELAASSPGRLVVYDLAGRRLAVLLEGELPAGPQSVTWNGHDQRGRALGSGTYLCRLETAAGHSSLKLNLTR